MSSPSPDSPAASRWGSSNRASPSSQSRPGITLGTSRNENYRISMQISTPFNPDTYIDTHSTTPATPTPTPTISPTVPTPTPAPAPAPTPINDTTPAEVKPPTPEVGRAEKPAGEKIPSGSTLQLKTANSVAQELKKRGSSIKQPPPSDKPTTSSTDTSHHSPEPAAEKSQPHSATAATPDTTHPTTTTETKPTPNTAHSDAVHTHHTTPTAAATATTTTTKPTTDATERKPPSETAPAAHTERKPSSEVVVTERKPSNETVSTERKPSNEAVSTERKPSSEAVPKSPYHSLIDHSNSKSSLARTASTQRLTPDEEKEKMKVAKEAFREEVNNIVRELKIQFLITGANLRMYTKNKMNGVQGHCKLSADKKELLFQEKVGIRTDDEAPNTTPIEQISITGLLDAEPSLPPTLDPQFAASMAKKEYDPSLVFSLTFKDQNTSAIVFVLGSRNEITSWHDGFACLMGKPLNSTIIKSDVELLCEVLALDRLYPIPPPPSALAPELLAALEQEVV